MSYRKMKRIEPIPGLVRGKVRADANPSLVEISALVGKLGAAFDAFKSANDDRIKALEKGKEDVVTTEKVDKINGAVGDLDKELRALSVKVEAARTASSDDKTLLSPEAKEHKKAFNSMLRKGVDAGLNDLAVKASLSTDSNPDGGYVVPEELDRNITRVMGKTLGMRGLARVISVGAPTYKAIHNMAGATGGWVGERGSRAQTDTPKLAELSFPAMEQYAMPAATQTMLDDAFFDIEGWLTEEVSIVFTEMEGDAFVNGDGLNQPRGFLAYGFAASTPSAPSAWGKIGYTPTGADGAFAANPNGGDALIDLIHSLKPGYRANASWLMNDATAAKVRKLKDGNDDYLWQQSLQVGQPSQLLGYGTAFDDGMPDMASNKYPIAFGDFNRGYNIIDRLGTRVLRDPYSTKPYVLFYVTRRVGGGVRDFHAIKVLKAAGS